MILFDQKYILICPCSTVLPFFFLFLPRQQCASYDECHHIFKHFCTDQQLYKQKTNLFKTIVKKKNTREQYEFKIRGL